MALKAALRGLISGKFVAETDLHVDDGQGSASRLL